METTAGLLAARDADALWSLAMTSVRRVLNADRAAIYLYDRANDRLSCAYASGLSPEYIGELNRRFREAPGSRLLSTRQPVSVDDVQTDPTVAPLREWMLREGFRSYAVFPLLRSHGVYGAFVAYRDAVAPFTDADITSGQTLGHLLGLTLETIHLYSETRTKAAELGSLYAAAQDMAASLMDPHALLNALAHHITEALGATSGNIVSINEAGGTIQVLAEYYSEAACAGEEKDDLGRVYSMQEFPTIMHAMLVGEPLTLQEDDIHLSNAERSQFEEYGARSMLFIPIMAHGKLFGDAEIWESRRRREFTLAEILLAQAMASHAAAIIENSQLFEELERREAHFRALTENAAEGVALLDARGRFTYITPTEEKILGYDHLKVIGQYVFDIVHPEDRHRAESAFQKSLQHPDELVIVEYRAMHADGSWRHLEVAIKNLLGEPNIKSLVGNFRDISERKRAEAEIQRHADDCEK